MIRLQGNVYGLGHICVRSLLLLDTSIRATPSTPTPTGDVRFGGCEEDREQVSWKTTEAEKRMTRLALSFKEH